MHIARARGFLHPARRAAPLEVASAALDARMALRVLHACFASFCIAVWIGIPWDFYWHTSRLFETFLSPPHFVIYGGTAIAGACALYLVATPRLRLQFGVPLKLPVLSAELPGSLQLLGGGLVVVVAAGLLDGSWHTAWGVNETNWSLPHALLAWGIFITYLGFLSARRALSPAVPPSLAARVTLALLGFAFSIAAMVGPFVLFSTPLEVSAVFARPGFQGQSTQTVLTVVRDFDLTRRNPLYIILLALWMGLALRLVEAIDARPRFVLLVASLATGLYGAISVAFALYVGTPGDFGSWLPPPILPVAAIALAIQRSGGGGRLAWLAAGGALVALTWALYPPIPSLAPIGLLGAPALLAGRRAGAFLARTVERPRRAGISTVLMVMGVILPLVAGALDLSMRLSIR